MDSDKVWAPPTAMPVYWSDFELRKMGWLTAVSALCEHQLKLIVKAVERLDYSQWLKLDRSPVADLVIRFHSAAPIDKPLHEIAERLLHSAPEAFRMRAELTHGITGEEGETGAPLSWHPRRNSLHDSGSLDLALQSMSDLTFEIDAAVKRTADLIIDGVLPGGTGRKGMLMRWRDQDVRF